MNLLFLHSSARTREHKPDRHTLTTGYGRQHDTSEGSEFLDDTIRMKDQPLSYDEENNISDNHKNHGNDTSPKESNTGY